MSIENILTATYKPHNKILWDSWFIKKEDEYHAFYLQTDPVKRSEDRHTSFISIGHAVSHDLQSWVELPTALLPGGDDAWDNGALWSGSVIEKDGAFYLFYTGRKNDRGVFYQAIGLATSPDLREWKKYPSNPVVTVADQYYQTGFQKNSLGNIGAWRDPYVFADTQSKKYMMTISARDKALGSVCNACIALATSDDLINWTLEAPIFSPHMFEEMETSQVIQQDGRYYLFFSSLGNITSKKCGAGLSNGLYCFVADDVRGTFKPVNDNGLVCLYGSDIFDMRLIPIGDNEYAGISWVGGESQGAFVGALAKPVRYVISGTTVKLA